MRSAISRCRAFCVRQKKRNLAAGRPDHDRPSPFCRRSFGSNPNPSDPLRRAEGDQQTTHAVIYRAQLLPIGKYPKSRLARNRPALF